MSEATEHDDSEELDDEEVEEILGDDEVDLERVYRDIESAKKRAARKGEPAWRVLEQRRERALTQAQISDLGDYQLDDVEVEMQLTSGAELAHRHHDSEATEDYVTADSPRAAEG
jgi:hypothetical protein